MAVDVVLGRREWSRHVTTAMMEFGSTDATSGAATEAATEAKTGADGFQVTARPNSFAAAAGLPIAMALLMPCCLVAGAAFVSLGAWPVALFMALPLLGLAAAFHCLWRHAGDFEQLTLRGDRLIVDRHSASGDEHLELNSQWVQVVLRPVGFGCRLVLRCHGKELPFGPMLTDDERKRLAAELKRRLALLRH